MEPFYFGIFSAFWLGILTSISPCPLATNIAAVSFIGKKLEKPKMVFWAGILYMIGRTLAYTVLAILIVASILSIPEIAGFLDEYINKILGPILIIAGLFLLGMIKPLVSGGGISDKLRDRVESAGVWGAGLLGIIFALSFCPISAALFFGSVIPLSLKYQSSVILPSVYGIGTGLPVIVFAYLIMLGARFVGVFFEKISSFEKWARRITGIVFVIVGIYYVLVYLAGLSI
jgi:cytochrome c biogenesis protein CcdA